MEGPVGGGGSVGGDRGGRPALAQHREAHTVPLTGVGAVPLAATRHRLTGREQAGQGSDWPPGGTGILRHQRSWIRGHRCQVKDACHPCHVTEHNTHKKQVPRDTSRHMGGHNSYIGVMPLPMSRYRFTFKCHQPHVKARTANISRHLTILKSR